jgi:hypothetical protein
MAEDLHRIWRPTMPRKQERPAKGGPRVSARERSAPKTTRPEAELRREPEAVQTAGERIGRRLDAVPDRIDVRDWFYQPSLAPLPDVLINCDSVPEILDQGAEGACTGFALAAVVNFLLQARNLNRRVSPRMLYEMARRYDEWPGENYEGSSARGAMKGWVAHGVVPAPEWTMKMTGARHLTSARAKMARSTPGGAYYRVMHRQVRDMHAALHETGILYVTLMVHAGWDTPGPFAETVQYVESGNLRTREFPVIARRGRSDSGHAVAIVGYTTSGFIIQNSWGPSWGKDGFALLPYEDYLLHATDVWVAQLGVPVTVDTWAAQGVDSAGLSRAADKIPLDDIRPFVVDVGNNGELSGQGHYWTTEEDLDRLFTDEIPKRSAGWTKRRLMLYLHGGLNDEQQVARRIVAFRDVFLANEIYPLHIMWESGAGESLAGMLKDLFTDVDERAGKAADWLKKLREGLVEAKDRTLELSAAAPGSKLWAEMKENAKLASKHPDGKGGMQLLAAAARRAFKGFDAKAVRKWELHVVAHSAGSIFAAHALDFLATCGVPFMSLQFMAPAITAELFHQTLGPAVRAKTCPHPSLYILSDVGERDDTVRVYGKSLLYLVSNAFEGRRDTPLLGMQRFLGGTEADDDRVIDRELAALFSRKVNGLPSLVIAGRDQGPGSVSRSQTHGGFDNDPDSMNSVLFRILGGAPARPFTTRDLQF